MRSASNGNRCCWLQVFVPTLLTIACADHNDPADNVEYNGVQLAITSNDVVGLSVGVDSNGAGQTQTVQRPEERALREDEIPRDRAGDPPLPEATPSDDEITRDTLQELRGRGDARVQIVLTFKEHRRQNSRALHGLDVVQKEEVLNERARTVRASQQSVVARLQALGATVGGSVWLGTNALFVSLPAQSVGEVSSWSEVANVSVSRTGGEANWDMKQATDATRVRRMTTNGHDGNVWNRSSSSTAVRIGIIEHGSFDGCNDNWPGNGHVAFKDSPTTSSRIEKRYACPWPGCSTQAAQSSPSSGMHGHKVTGVAIASIEQGQDSAFTTTTERRQRSGASKEAVVYYYAMNCAWAEVALAVQQAVVDKVDIVNMSFGFDSCTENLALQATSNAAINAAFDAGVVFVGSSGNSQTSDTDPCGILWPAFRPEVIAVAGLNPTGSTPYGEAPFGERRLGGMPITVSTGHTSTFSGIDFSAPGCFKNTLTSVNSGTTAYASGELCGSSLAAPFVAGFAANLRDAFAEAGWYAWIADAGVLTTNILLSGDGWDGWNPSGGSSYQESGTNRRTGYGRLVARYPRASGHDNAAWNWTIVGKSTIAPYSVHTWTLFGGAAIPSGITELKVAMTFVPDSLTNAPDITLRMTDCGGTFISSDVSWDVRKKLFVPGSKVAGKCVKVEVRSHGLPNATEPYWLAYYYHSDPKH